MNDSAAKVRDVLSLIVRAALVSDDAKSLAHRRQAEEARRRMLTDGPSAERVNVDGA